MCEQLQRLARGDLVLESGRLQHDADSLLHLARSPRGVYAGDLNLALVRDAQADDAFEQRGLAGAVRPEQAEDLAFADVQRDAADGLYVTVRFLQAANGDDVRRDNLIAASTCRSGTRRFGGACAGSSAGFGIRLNV